MLYSQLIFVDAVKGEFSFYLHVDIQLCQQYLLKD